MKALNNKNFEFLYIKYNNLEIKMEDPGYNHRLYLADG